MIPPPVAGGASFRNPVISRDQTRRLGTAEAGGPTTSYLETGHDPALWRGRQQVVG